MPDTDKPSKKTAKTSPSRRNAAAPIRKKSTAKRPTTPRAAPDTTAVREAAVARDAARTTASSANAATGDGRGLQRAARVSGSATGQATGSPRATPLGVSPEERRRMIAETAYLKAARRGFAGGNPQQDWLEAEAEIDARLMREAGRG